MYGDEKEKINLRGYIIRPADFQKGVMSRSPHNPFSRTKLILLETLCPRVSEAVSTASRSWRATWPLLPWYATKATYFSFSSRREAVTSISWSSRASKKACSASSPLYISSPSSGTRISNANGSSGSANGWIS